MFCQSDRAVHSDVSITVLILSPLIRVSICNKYDVLEYDRKIHISPSCTHYPLERPRVRMEVAPTSRSDGMEAFSEADCALAKRLGDSHIRLNVIAHQRTT